MVEKQGNLGGLFLTMSRSGGPNIGGCVWGTRFFPPAPKVYEPIAGTKRPEVREIGLESQS